MSLKNFILTFVLFTFSLSLFSCGHSEPIPDKTVKTEAQPAKEFRFTYPESKTDSVVEEINGYKVEDPYRWLEDENAAKEWIEAQNNFTADYIDRNQIAGLAKRVEELFDIGFISGPMLAGDKIFYLKRDDPDLEQPLVMMKKGEVESVLLDPNEIDKTGQTSVDWMYPSRDGRLLAYGLSKNGDENSTLYILETDTLNHLEDSIPNTRHTSLCWLPDESGFYYVRYPEGDRYNRKAYFHKLGTDPAKDPLIFGDKKLDKIDWTSLEMSKDGRYLLIIEFRGHSDTDLYLYDIKKKKLKTLFTKPDFGIKSIQMVGDTIYMLTDYKTPNGKLVSFNKNKPTPKHWKTIVKEGKWPISWFMLSKNKIVLHKLEDVSSHLYAYSTQGEKLSEITLDTLGTIGGFDLDYNTNRMTYIFTSFFYPTTLYLANIENEIKPQIIGTVKSNINVQDYVAKQVKYPSYDGTWVNLFIVYKKGTEQNGNNQTLLYGYGGFQVDMPPYFSRRTMAWIERGGIYAVANIRGGGEYGEDWHKGGMLGKKHQVFRDFEYAMRYLIKEKYTSPSKLVISGGSNGGLLMGAMMTEAPYLFAAAMGSVGLYDMIRYHKFPPAELWVDEYGSSDNESDTGFLLGYSPYHQVINSVKYPAFLGDTAMSDTRVHWLHTAKFVAALQNATVSNQPILFHLESKAGHGSGKKKSMIAKEYADKFVFMFSIVGDPAENK